MEYTDKSHIFIYIDKVKTRKIMSLEQNFWPISTNWEVIKTPLCRWKALEIYTKKFLTTWWKNEKKIDRWYMSIPYNGFGGPCSKVSIQSKSSQIFLILEVNGRSFDPQTWYMTVLSAFETLVWTFICSLCEGAWIRPVLT